MSPAYPFAAIVGLADLRLALLVNAVSPAIGGVLVRGEKGTAKSTVVRGLAALLPEVSVVAGCRFACDPHAPDRACPDGPHDRDSAAGREIASDGASEIATEIGGERRPARLVELPVGASEDRLLGSLDLERALAQGVTAYEPGLLAAAHRGVLYVDEVNLLHDHLVDLLLDAAALGTCYVEREGVSVRHAARFLLVGTMNPEEGELRPQLLDRFGLTVQVTASRDPAERAEVVRRRLAFESDPEGFAAAWKDDEADLAERIAAARRLLPRVSLPEQALHRIARVCAAFDVDGLRADIVTARTAIALAAWHGRIEVGDEDVRQAALLALPHRRRRDPFDAPGLDPGALDEALGEDTDPSGGGQAPDPPPDPTPDPDPGPGSGQHPPLGEPDGRRDPGPVGEHRAPGAEAAEAETGVTSPAQPQPQRPAEPGQTYRARLLTVPGLGRGAAGRRSRARTPTGRTARAARPEGAPRALHLPATVRAAAPHQIGRGRGGRPGLVVRAEDLRVPVREGRESNLVVFVVDASGSMGARSRMHAVKGAALSLLLDAYQRRDKVGLVTFRGAAADLALPPTSSVEVGAARLRTLATGGRTPLAAGLLTAHDLLRRERLRDPDRRPLLVVLTDGRATAARAQGANPAEEARRAAALLRAEQVASVVVDCEDGPVRLGLAPRLAADLGGAALRLDELAADRLAGLVRDLRGAA